MRQNHARGTPGVPAADQGSPPGLRQRTIALLTSPLLLLILAVLFWSGNFIVGRGARELIPPVAFNFWRWVIALLILLPFCWHSLWRNRSLIRREWRIISALAISGITAFHSAVYLGLAHSEALNGFVYFATSPLFFVLFAWLLFRDRVEVSQAAGILVSMAGAAVVIARGDPAILLGLELAVGDLWLIAAVALWALYSVLLRRRPEGLPPLALICVVVGFALAFLLPFYALELWSGRRVEINRESLASLLYVSVFASVIAYIFWNRGVREAGPNAAGVSLQLMPVFGALLAVAFLDERMAVYHWLGAGLVLAGIVLARRRA